MPHANPTANRATWQVGQRVCRKSTEELGTVIRVNGSIKVKWDRGSTSYFRHEAIATAPTLRVPGRQSRIAGRNWNQGAWPGVGSTHTRGATT